jgi:hypothetical protein
MYYKNPSQFMEGFEMSDDKPQGDGVPMSRTEMLEKFLASGRQVFADGRVPEEIEQTTGVSASKYKLVDRRVEVGGGTCGKGHFHKDILLIEVFKNAAEGVEPKLTLDAALDQFQAEALVEPAGSLGHAEPTQGVAGVRAMPDGTVQKLLVLRQAFETETSLIGHPGQMSPEMAAYLRFMQSKRFGGGFSPPANDAN